MRAIMYQLATIDIQWYIRVRCALDGSVANETGTLEASCFACWLVTKIETPRKFACQSREGLEALHEC